MVRGEASGSGAVGAHSRILPQGHEQHCAHPQPHHGGVAATWPQQRGTEAATAAWPWRRHGLGKANDRMGWGPHVIDTKQTGGINIKGFERPLRTGLGGKI
jgi:hypothetical protein